MVPPAADDPTRRQLRGSTLLLAGRLLSLAINFAAQVVVVRYLSTEDYGALAYALTVISLIGGLSTLGLPGALSRFAPMYHERADYARLGGAIVLSLGMVAVASAVLITFVFAGAPAWAHLVDSRQALTLISLLVFVVPLEGLERILIALFASFSHARAVFFRRHILAPAFRLAVALALVAFEADVRFVAYGYLSACTVGLLLNSVLLVGLLRRDGILGRLHWRELALPIRDLLLFTVPLLTSELVLLAMQTVSTLLLGYFHDSTEVAHYRVILPVANLNTMVMGSFALLYLPAASRMLARRDRGEVNALYWRTAIWVAVLTLPIFVVTFSFARPLVLLLYGERYAASAPLLQLLAAAYYFNAALGFNSLTLTAVGRVRLVVALNVASVLLEVLVAFALIPTGGAKGAAVATASAMVLHNVLAQAGLRIASGVNVFEPRFLSFYSLITVCVFVLFAAERWAGAGPWVMAPLAAAASLLVLVASRRRLEIENTFPELLRLPLLGPLLRSRA